LPLLEFMQPADFYATRDLTLRPDFILASMTHAAANLRDGLLQNRLPDGKMGNYAGDLAILLQNSARCDQAAPAEVWLYNWHKLAQFLTANLDQKSALGIWQAPPVTTCYARAKPALKAWIEFYRTVAARDGNEMSRQALLLLDNGAAGRNTELSSYLLAAAMLGAYRSGRPQDTVKIWDYHSTRLFKTDTEIPHYFHIIDAAADAAANERAFLKKYRPQSTQATLPFFLKEKRSEP
jgi:hypothetical protein